jgi:hypothetical protein
MPTSAMGATVVMTGGVTLFVRLGSVVGELTACHVGQRAGGRRRDGHVTLLTWPLVKVPKLQLTLPLLLHPATAGADKRHVGNGKVSVTTTLLALDGPKFVTEIV